MRPVPKFRRRLLAGAAVLTLALPTGVAIAAEDNGNHGASAQGSAQNDDNGQSASSSGNSAADVAPAVVTTAAVPQNTTDENLNNPNSIGNGANVSGPYDGAPDGPSMNGNDDSNSNKPCAGCVGQADDKNPHGQMPGGNDHNAGYECDRNQGVGQGNPAHSPCVADTPPPPPGTPETPTTPTTPTTPVAPVEPAAPTPPATPDEPVAPDTDTPDAPVAGEQDEPDEAAAEELPFTGAEIGLIAWLGMVLTGIGIAMARRFRGKGQEQE